MVFVFSLLVAMVGAAEPLAGSTPVDQLGLTREVAEELQALDFRTLDEIFLPPWREVKFYVNERPEPLRQSIFDQLEELRQRSGRNFGTSPVPELGWTGMFDVHRAGVRSLAQFLDHLEIFRKRFPIASTDIEMLRMRHALAGSSKESSADDSTLIDELGFTPAVAEYITRMGFQTLGELTLPTKADFKFYALKAPEPVGAAIMAEVDALFERTGRSFGSSEFADLGLPYLADIHRLGVKSFGTFLANEAVVVSRLQLPPHLISDLKLKRKLSQPVAGDPLEHALSEVLAANKRLADLLNARQPDPNSNSLRHLFTAAARSIADAAACTRRFLQ